MTEVSLDVNIMSDRLLESDEMFQLSINSSLLPNRVIVGNPSEVTVTIVDNDRMLFILCIVISIYMINHYSYYCQLQSVNIQC